MIRRSTHHRWALGRLGSEIRPRPDHVRPAAAATHPAATDSKTHDRRFRAAERRDLREAVRYGAVIGSAVLGVDILVHGPTDPVLIAVNLVGILALGVLFTHRARRRPHAAALAATLVLLWASAIPEVVRPSGTVMLAGYLSLIVVGTAVFLPWGRSWHLAWLAIATSTSLAVPIVTGRPLEYVLEAAILTIAAAATSAAGNALVGRRRDRAHQQKVLLHEQRGELRRLSIELREVASRDSLTGLGNRRRLTEDIADLDARLGREAMPGVAAIMLDLDHFKTYNDRAGHPAGDEVLRVVAGAVRAAVREIDRVYRYGGEEVLVLLEEPTREGALLAARRILDAVRRLALPHVAQPGHVVTMSAGAAAQAGPGVSVWHVIEAADQALYEAKRAGRDRAVLARPLSPIVGFRLPARQVHRPDDEIRDEDRPDPGLARVPSAG